MTRDTVIADTPAARATTSSEERDSRQNASSPPSSTAKGRSCMATKGRRRPAICATSAKPASCRVAARRSSSRLFSRPSSARVSAGQWMHPPRSARVTRSPSWRPRDWASCTETDTGLSQVILVRGSGVSCSQLLLPWRPSKVAKPVVRAARPELPVFTAPHPSPTIVCTHPSVGERIVAALSGAAAEVH